MSFDKPPEGSVITCTTKYSEYYYLATEPFRYHTYSNVRVLSYHDNLLGPNDIKIECDNKDGFILINLNYVVELSVGGKKMKSVRSNEPIRTIEVQGSKGQTYTLVIKHGQPASCTCPQFSFRKQKCKHMLSVEDEIG